MQNYQGKHVWIIGASSGIGHALAKELSARGAILSLSARSQEKLEHLNQSLGGVHHVHAFDVTDVNKFEETSHTIQKHTGRLDSVVFLAALYDPMACDKFDLKKVRQIVDVNLMGVFHLVHAVLPLVQMQKRGQIAICGSVAGFVGLPNGQPYSATKAAVINLVESLKAENPELDIKLINPGFVRTGLTDKNEFDMPMMIEPEQAAREIVNGLLKSSFEIHFPKRFTVLVKLLRLLPYSLYLKLASKISQKDNE